MGGLLLTNCMDFECLTPTGRKKGPILPHPHPVGWSFAQALLQTIRNQCLFKLAYGCFIPASVVSTTTACLGTREVELLPLSL